MVTYLSYFPKDHDAKIVAPKPFVTKRPPNKCVHPKDCKSPLTDSATKGGEGQ
jgi:hypothetical protein